MTTVLAITALDKARLVGTWRVTLHTHSSSSNSDGSSSLSNFDDRHDGDDWGLGGCSGVGPPLNMVDHEVG